MRRMNELYMDLHEGRDTGTKDEWASLFLDMEKIYTAQFNKLNKIINSIRKLTSNP